MPLKDGAMRGHAAMRAGFDEPPRRREQPLFVGGHFPPPRPCQVVSDLRHYASGVYSSAVCNSTADSVLEPYPPPPPPLFRAKPQAPSPKP